MSFTPPRGIAFCLADEVAITDLCEILQQVGAFLQNTQVSSPKLYLYHDWWEHDGLHFEQRVITFHELFAMIETPRAIFESTPDDEYVFVGIAPVDARWYLRYRATWDEDGRGMAGIVAVILPSELAADFRLEVVAISKHQLIEESSDNYYERIKT